MHRIVLSAKINVFYWSAMSEASTSSEHAYMLKAPVNIHATFRGFIRPYACFYSTVRVYEASIIIHRWTKLQSIQIDESGCERHYWMHWKLKKQTFSEYFGRVCSEHPNDSSELPRTRSINTTANLCIRFSGILCVFCICTAFLILFLIYLYYTRALDTQVAIINK